jgi:hypothetical protein
MTAAYQSSIAWQRAGAIASGQLGDARETLHHAAQLLALVGASYIPARADDSHTSMRWLGDAGALATEIVEAARPFRVAIRASDLTLLFLEASGREAGVFPLSERTRDEAIAWLRARIADAGRDPTALRTSLHFSISRQPTDDGAPFVRQSGRELEELSRWYANANAVLEAQRAQRSGSGDVRCWPHHFDIATLVTVSGGAFQTIGIGMSPGDAITQEPYFYVSPYPRPTNIVATLEVGRWHTTDWWGALLLSSEIVAVTSPSEQLALVTGFINGAFSVLVNLQKETPR